MERGEKVSKEITITFTADFTAIVKDEADMKLIEENAVEDLRKMLEQDANCNTNYDQIIVRDFKVFLGGDE